MSRADWQGRSSDISLPKPESAAGRLRNGDLIQAGEAAGFDVFVTADKNIRYQQNPDGRTIGMIVLTEQRWTQVKKRLPEIAAAVSAASPGSYTEVESPFR